MNTSTGTVREEGTGRSATCLRGSPPRRGRADADAGADAGAACRRSGRATHARRRHLATRLRTAACAPRTRRRAPTRGTRNRARATAIRTRRRCTRRCTRLSTSGRRRDRLGRSSARSTWRAAAAKHPCSSNAGPPRPPHAPCALAGLWTSTPPTRTVREARPRAPAPPLTERRRAAAQRTRRPRRAPAVARTAGRLRTSARGFSTRRRAEPTVATTQCGSQSAGARRTALRMTWCCAASPSTSLKPRTCTPRSARLRGAWHAGTRGTASAPSPLHSLSRPGAGLFCLAAPRAHRHRLEQCAPVRSARLLLIATPHKRPHVAASTGWEMLGEVVRARVRVRLYSSTERAT